MKKYLCGITFNYELGETDEISVYDSFEDLKTAHSCYEECGVVEIEVSDPSKPEEYTDHKWLVEMDMDKMWANAKDSSELPGNGE